MEEKIALFFKMQSPSVAKKLRKVCEWIAEVEQDMRPAWRWNTLFYQINGKDCLYLLVKEPAQVKVGFVQGAKLTCQELLENGEKKYVRHFLIEPSAACRRNFKQLLKEALAIALGNSDQ